MHRPDRTIARALLAMLLTGACAAHVTNVGDGTTSSAASSGVGGAVGGSPGTGGDMDAGDGGDSDLADSGDSGDSADADPCGNWFDNLPGGACSVSSAIECGGNEPQWTSFCWFRCCNGHWLGPTTPDGCSQGGPPCGDGG
jgi:hypothetical protein